jgi:hypothetical protein
MKNEKKPRRERGEGRLYKRLDSNYWWLQFYANGVQVRESTKTDDEKKAGKLLLKRLGQVEAEV